MKLINYDIYKLSELIGIIIGDGNIYYNPQLKKYYFEITGDPNLEKEYFHHISDLIFDLLNKKPNIRKGGRGLRLRLYSKNFVEFLINIVKLPYGEGKCEVVTIPDCIYSQNWDIIKKCIRGITDTDGSLFLSKKYHRNDYPCVEISTVSESLAFQLKGILSPHYRLGFRSFSAKNSRKRYIISINGDIMVNKWINDIGFSNPHKGRKAYDILKMNGTGGI